MSGLNVRRLTILARHLYNLEAKAADSNRRFDMSTWYRSSVNADAYAVKLKATDYGCEVDTSPAQVTCATAACAFGEAVSIPEFQRDGLKFERWNASETTIKLVPHYNGFTGFGAAREFFGLQGNQARQLFGGDEEYGRAQGATKPSEVADRIMGLLAGEWR
jgi:hypothetical protein